MTNDPCTDDILNMKLKDVIALKQAEGYDPVFEAALAQRWVCPHCDHETNFTGILIPVGEGSEEHDASCPACLKEGIVPVETGEPELKVIEGGKL